MIGPFVARVAFHNCKNCFISVPQHFLPPNLTNQLVAFNVYVDDGHSSYFSWSGEVTSSPAARNAVSTDLTVEINGLYALKLGLREEQEVLVTQVPNVAHLERLNVEPVAVDDWEILELHADYVQNNLLNQVRIVWSSQILPVWVEHNVCIFIRISDLAPECPVGRLEQMTEVHVSPKARKVNSESSGTTSHSTIDSGRSSRKNEAIVSEDGDKSSVEETSNGALSSPLSSNGWWPASGSLLKDVVGRWILGNHSSSIIRDDQDEKHEDTIDSHLLEAVDFEVKLRVHSSDRLQEILCECPNGDPFDTRRLSIQPYTAFVMSSCLPVECGRPLTIAKMSRVVPPYEISEKVGLGSKKSTLKTPKAGSDSSKSNITPTVGLEESKRPSKEVRRTCYVKVVVVDALLGHLDGHWKNFNFVASRVMDLMIPGVVYVPVFVRQHLGCEVTSRVALKFGTRTFRRPHSLKLCSVKRMVHGVSTAALHLDVCHWLSSVCSDKCPIVATSGSVLQVVTDNELEEQFVLKDDYVSAIVDDDNHGDDTMALFVSPSVKVELQLNGVTNSQLPILKEVPVVGLKSAAVGGLDDLIHRGLTFLVVNLGLGPLSDHLKQCSKGASGSSGGLLISGPRGSGKTTLAQTLSRELADTAYRVHCSYVACKSLKGKRVESVFRVLLRTFQEATYRAPSIVLLDDLDHLIGTSSNLEHEFGGVGGYHLRMSTALLEILKAVRVSRNAPVVVVATCLSAASLHPTLSSSQGLHIFQDILDINSPTMEQRSSILQRLLLSKTIISSESLCSAEDLRLVLTQTESFVALDLNMLVDRAVHIAASRTSNLDCELVLRVEDLENALVDFMPASLRGLQLQTTRSKSWKDVGGLRAVKQALIETLQWPAKYPEIFLWCPLPMRSGVLLYGPPGTGKTLLASVVANECNMNFISIKGPELLSKYIGASEQSVRDLFQRAANAKPCVIFFDEFDSLASKRGHDSTGVTDRVVNQLLTQMDGVEGRQGVYVLAATSRPDLIDPALLRPGRFDRCLCCPMPSQEERVEILEALTSKPVNLSPNVDLIEIAAFCDHFSGADLQGLLCNAQLKAIHRLSTSDVSVKLSANSSLDEFCCVDNNDKGVSSVLTDDNSGTIFLPSLEEGILHLSDLAAREKIEEQVDVILSNTCGWERHCRKPESTPSSPTTTCRTTVLTNEDLLDALADMKPSVSARERQRYEAIYQTFTKSRGGHFSGTEVVVPVTSVAGTQRATLA